MRVLEFDHLPDADKRGDIGWLVNQLMSWEVARAEIEKCEVRCANCHRRRTAERGVFWRHRWYVAQHEAFDPVARLESLLLQRVT
jgi:hypothetical protein